MPSKVIYETLDQHPRRVLVPHRLMPYPEEVRNRVKPYCMMSSAGEVRHWAIGEMGGMMDWAMGFGPE